MRASFDPDLILQDSYVITHDRHHHLVNVIRIERGDELLLLNGKGLQVLTSVESISKRELRLKFVSEKQGASASSMDLALGIPKKDALELSLKQATELGFRKIYLVRSKYSQVRVPEADRLSSILVSALEQSNASYLPLIEEVSWEEIPWDNYDSSLMLDSQSQKRQKTDQKAEALSLLVVGPEGGFSPEEISYLHARPRMEVVTLPTPILRTPTALATGAGILLGRLLD